MFVFLRCAVCPRSPAGPLCRGFGQRCAGCPVLQPPGTSPQAGHGESSRHTLFPSGSQKRHESSQRFSRCCIHLQRPWKAPHAPAPGPLLSVTLGAPRLRDWHLSVTPLLALESSSASGLKKLHFRLQQEQERHTKYKCRGRET